MKKNFELPPFCKFLTELVYSSLFLNDNPTEQETHDIFCFR